MNFELELSRDNFDFRFSHAGLVILPQKQNPDDLFLGPRYEENALVSNIMKSIPIEFPIHQERNRIPAKLRRSAASP